MPHAKSNTVQDIRVTLCPDMCVVLGKGDAVLSLKQVTFEGMSCCPHVLPLWGAGHQSLRGYML